MDKKLREALQKHQAELEAVIPVMAAKRTGAQHRVDALNEVMIRLHDDLQSVKQLLSGIDEDTKWPPAS